MTLSFQHIKPSTNLFFFLYLTYESKQLPQASKFKQQFVFFSITSLNPFMHQLFLRTSAILSSNNHLFSNLKQCFLYFLNATSVSNNTGKWSDVEVVTTLASTLVKASNQLELAISLSYFSWDQCFVPHPFSQVKICLYHATSLNHGLLMLL